MHVGIMTYYGIAVRCGDTVYLVAVVAAPRQGTNTHRAYMSYEHTTYDLSKVGCSQLVAKVVVKQ
jgi:hypothetical protein